MDLMMGPLGSVLLKLGELLREEYNLQTGLREEIKTLTRDLESMHAALRKVAQVPWNELDEDVKLWARDIREVSYSAEDILDTFLVRVQGQTHSEEKKKEKWYKHAAGKIREVFSKIKPRHEIAGMIKIINEKAKEVEIRRGRYKADDIVAKRPSTSTVDPRLKLLYRDVTQLVGMEKSTSELESMLSSSQQHGMNEDKLKIVSVVGFGGIGKTTLAKVVYEKTKSEYECSAFVAVGQKPVLAVILKNILFVLSPEVYRIARKMDSIELLSGELQNILKNKRYLIVIDDIWEIESWETIYTAFPEDNKGSRIIMTTRKAGVAAGVVYKLEALSYNNSRRLFYTRIFGGEDKCPNNHPEELSNTILEKCGGVPLAIVTMASLLLGKSRLEWYEVCKSPGFYRNNENRHMENTMHILSLSYYDLPSHLKTCMLYLSVFPEDSFIDKDSLIRKWIAEGFIEKKPGRGLLEVGEEYFNELINRSMITAVDSKVYGIMHVCRVHDMVLDLIVSISHEENFASVNGTLSQSQARRLATKGRELDLTQDTNQNLPQVRSFILSQCDISMWALHPRLNLVRVLALEDCTLREGCQGLEHIGKLLHLRYLNIPGVDIFELCKEIGNLKFLQSLDVKVYGTLGLPYSIGNLTRLVCLCVRQVISVPVGVVGKLTALEKLQIEVHKESDESSWQLVMDLGNLCELRVLKINVARWYLNHNMQIDLIQSLGSLQKMQHLTLYGPVRNIANMDAWDAAVLSQHLRCLFLEFIEFPRLPSWINYVHLPSLSHLEIHLDHLDDKDLIALAGLPELYYLCLHTLSTATMTCTNNEADGCFQKLRSLVLPYSMIQFVANEDSSSSFTILGPQYRHMASGRSKKKDNCGVGSTSVVMPSLEEVQFRVDVEFMKNKAVSFGELGLEYLSSIRKVKVDLWCYNPFGDGAVRGEAALRHAIQVHPNQPTLAIEYSLQSDK